jgi:hypothetical protein
MTLTTLIVIGAWFREFKHCPSEVAGYGALCHLQILVLIPVPDDSAEGARGCRPGYGHGTGRHGD